jgi:hypothetical protein
LCSCFASTDTAEDEPDEEDEAGETGDGRNRDAGDGALGDGA